MNIQYNLTQPACTFAAQELDFFFVSYTGLLAHITELLADGHAEEAKDLFITEFEPMVQRHELIDQSGLDVYLSLLILGRTFRPSYK